MNNRNVDKLKQASGNSHYFNDRNSIGFYVKDNFVTLLDSGIDDATAKKIDQLIKEKKWVVKAIINTHSHADHCGGNSYFQAKYPDIKIYSTAYERPFIEDPRLEPICFCSGAAPFSELHNKFLEAKPSVVTHVIAPYQDQVLQTAYGDFRIVTLPGHTPGMIGIITEDNVLYTGDAIFAGDTFTKHGVLFYTNIKDTLYSLDKLALLDVDACVYYHGGFSTQALKEVTEQHREKILATKLEILKIISAAPAMSLDQLTGKVANAFGINASIVQFTLTRTVVNAYITQLQQEKEIALVMEAGVLVVQSLNQQLINEMKQIPTCHFNVLNSFEILPDAIHEKGFQVRIGFRDNAEITGEMHVDHKILNDISALIKWLVAAGYVANENIVIKSADNLAHQYMRAYPCEHVSAGVAENRASITAFDLHDHHLQLTMTAPNHHLIQSILKSSLTEKAIPESDAECRLSVMKM